MNTNIILLAVVTTTNLCTNAWIQVDNYPKTTLWDMQKTGAPYTQLNQDTIECLVTNINKWPVGYFSSSYTYWEGRTLRTQACVINYNFSIETNVTHQLLVRTVEPVVVSSTKTNTYFFELKP